MAANSAQIKNLLLPGLYKVAGQYERYPKEWDKIFTTVKSTLQTETAVQTRILGLAQLKVEGRVRIHRRRLHDLDPSGRHRLRHHHR